MSSGRAVDDREAATHVSPLAPPSLSSVASIGRFAASLARVAALTYLIGQMIEVAGILPTPWSGIAVYAPCLLMAMPFMVAMTALHYQTPPAYRFWSGVAVLIAAMYATFATLEYVVQLTVVLPYDSSNAIINAASPHTMFWSVDAVSYILLGLSMFFAYRLFWRPGIERWTRRFFLANAAVTPLLCVAYFYPSVSTALLILASPWAITGPGALLCLALYFSSLVRSSRPRAAGLSGPANTIARRLRAKRFGFRRRSQS